jgi:SAM-dependent methyltransferase
MRDINGRDPKEIVAQGYDRIGARYAAWTSRSLADPRSRYTALLLDHLPQGAAVLDLGCGAGIPTTCELAARFTVTGVDISAEQVERARRNVPGARFLHADMTALDLPPESFEAIVAFYSIIHVPRDEQAALLAKITTWLRPGGLFVAALGIGDSEAGYEADWLGAPMYWSSFDAATNRGLVRQAGFDLVSADVQATDEDGVPVRFLWVVARTPEATE